jgi:hypothetical protein
MHPTLLRRSPDDHDIACVWASMLQILRRIEKCDLDVVTALAACRYDCIDSARFELHRNNGRLALADRFDRAVADALKAQGGEMFRFLLQLLLDARCARRLHGANARPDEHGKCPEDRCRVHQGPTDEHYSSLLDNGCGGDCHSGRINPSS